MYWWMGGLIASAIGLAAGFSVSDWPVGDIWVVLGLGCVAALAERGQVTLSDNLKESISLLPTLFAAVLFGPLASLIVSAMSMLGGWVSGPSPYIRWGTYTASRSVTGALTGIAAVEAARLSLNQIASVAIHATSLSR
jgi:hypothetical protein